MAEIVALVVDVRRDEWSGEPQDGHQEAAQASVQLECFAKRRHFRADALERFGVAIELLANLIPESNELVTRHEVVK